MDDNKHEDIGGTEKELNETERDGSGKKIVVRTDSDSVVQEADTGLPPVEPPQAEENTSAPEADPSPVPAAPAEKAESATTPHTAGVIILQWLTYAFWGWTILAVIWLIYIVLANFILGTDMSGTIPYAIAATLVLLPLSFVCDFFYGRKETTKKTGAATVVMVIHAVIFALFGIGILISAVFTVVQISIGGLTDSKSSLVLLLTLFISAILYGFTFLRTLNPAPSLRIGLIYRTAMALIIGIFIILAFVGPVARSAATKDDRDIIANINGISEGINSYVQQKNELPASLSDVMLRPDAKALVDKGLVTYRPGDKVQIRDEKTSEISARAIVGVSSEYRYQLCAKYKEAADPDGDYYDNYNERDTYYPSIYPMNHPAGEVCYKVAATVYN